ncbi:MAG: hypothetical protein ACFE85_09705 [Candidatus Hodarchaeota archaeon]
MSEEEKFKSMLQEVKDIYLFLVEGKPSPDDEIEARENLIDLFRKLKNTNPDPEFDSEIEQILKSLEDWDTLDLWFAETSIPKEIEKMLKIPEHKTEHETSQIEEEPTVEPKPVVERTEIDLTQIVDKVSEQFKGEIDGLKGKIEELKKELEKKDATLASMSHKKKVEKITPKKESRLPPPKIKIPVIKKPSVTPKISSVTKPKEEKSIKEKLTTIPQESHVEPTKLEMQQLTPIPKKTPTITPIIIEEPKDRPLITEKRKVTPVIMEKPLDVPKSPKTSDKISVSMEKPKIASVRIEEIESESIQSSAKDLFNVFASVGEKTSVKSKSKTEIEQKIINIEKDEVKVKEANISKEKNEVSPFIDFNSGRPSTDNIFETSQAEELPSNKDTLYQELIALEGRRYSLEKNFKELDLSYNKGSIAESEYKKQNSILKKRLNDITTRINHIRRIISSI